MKFGWDRKEMLAIYKSRNITQCTIACTFSTKQIYTDSGRVARGGHMSPGATRKGRRVLKSRFRKKVFIDLLRKL